MTSGISHPAEPIAADAETAVREYGDLAALYAEKRSEVAKNLGRKELLANGKVSRSRSNHVRIATMTDLPLFLVFRKPVTNDIGMGHETPHQLGEQSIEYFRNRERTERAAAKKARSVAARHVHQELAQKYAVLLRNAP